MVLHVGFIIILLLVLFYVVKKYRGGQPRADLSADKSGNAEAAPSAGAATTPAVAPEAAAAKENAEFFSECPEQCTADSKVEYAVNDFGAPGVDYKDWILGAALDPEVVKNHATFVKDRQGTTTQNVTGRTYSPDSHTSYDAQPWVGIRGRPQAVPVRNPDQVSDMDYSLFPKKRKLTWDTSAYY